MVGCTPWPSRTYCIRAVEARWLTSQTDRRRNGGRNGQHPSNAVKGHWTALDGNFRTNFNYFRINTDIVNDIDYYWTTSAQLAPSLPCKHIPAISPSYFVKYILFQISFFMTFIYSSPGDNSVIISSRDNIHAKLHGPSTGWRNVRGVRFFFWVSNLTCNK